MRLATVFDIEITDWEELLVVGSFLLGDRIDTNIIGEVYPERIGECIEKLTSIPSSYAREICFEVLKEHHVNSSK